VGLFDRYEDAALAAYEGVQLDGSNEALHKIMRTAIELGRREHRRMQEQQAQAVAAAAVGNGQQ
jgi:hypothetical protein